jgi:hypothetical protein
VAVLAVLAVLAVAKIRISRRPSSLQPLLMRGNDLITAAGRACDHKLSQELAVGKEQSSWALWSEREANLIRDEDRSG